MFIDARTLEDAISIHTDVCIIGGGAAGITLARELAGTRVDVCVLESGGFEFDEETQALYKGEVVGFPYYALDGLRLRYFGGTTNHWAGVSRPLDEIDFENRPWVPASGWPFEKSHLEPFYRRAQSICQLGPYDYDAGTWETEDNPRLPFSTDRLITTMLQFSPPTRFGQVYRKELKEASNVKIYLFANAVEIETNSAGREAMRVLVTTLSGRRSSITAKVFILACGALENARLLLVSNRVPTRGLGNANDLVGRFFMEHLSIPAALFLPSDPHLPMGLYSQQTTSGTRALGYLAFPPETLRREELLNVRIIVAEASLQELTSKASQGVLSAGFLWNAFQRRELADDFTKHLLNVIGDIDDVAIHSYERAFAPRTGAFVINVDMEQAPRADSRVSLMSTRDRFGLQRLQLSWRFGSLEKETLRRVNDILALELGRAGLGRLKVLPDDEQTGWPTGLRGAWHQMGTTRMSTDPKLGVVDATCKVHGISNVFIAGSSVFPTSGYTNPTLTIVALAVRLADHIKKHLA